MSSFRRVSKAARSKGPPPARSGGGGNTFTPESKARERAERTAFEDDLDAKFGYERFTGDEAKGDRQGWLFNMRTTSIYDEGTRQEHSAVDLYFVDEAGGTFKATHILQPYFLLSIKGGRTNIQEVESFLTRKFEMIASIKMISKQDLGMPNHLSGLRAQFMKLSFRTVQDLMTVRKYVLPIVERNKKRQEAVDTYALDIQAAAAQSGVSSGSVLNSSSASGTATRTAAEALDCLIDIREYDVPYVERVAIDAGYRVGLWYTVKPVPGSKGVVLEEDKARVERPHLRTLAFDIETTKQPLKFPNPEFDVVMMISYMIDGEGFLIINREVVSEDIKDFEYTPAPEYPGPFEVANKRNELEVLQHFIDHIKRVRPQILVTYNGDYFDWPFVEKRLFKHGINMRDAIGVWGEGKTDREYMGRFCVHMDCFHWVQRDSYLPQGSQGLKSVTKYKLKYNPVELDPEQMLIAAQERPQELATYSVSDAVSTYYLYRKYVHLFIFSLCNIIPLPPSDVLRKGSGTLCEALLMVKAYESDIVCPNKQMTKHLSFWNGHLLDSETYVGGHVESLEAGVFRADLPCRFRLKPERLRELIADLDNTLDFAIKEADPKLSREDIANWEEVEGQIRTKLEGFLACPNIEVNPLIYHLDVGAMYPNIILTNRLQPMAIVDQATCAACDFNKPGKQCQRTLPWVWRGNYFASTKAEYHHIRQQLEYEGAPAANGKEAQPFETLNEEQQATLIKKRLKTYTQKVYKKILNEHEEEKEAIICQREHPFYVNTVMEFRDRRYQYKALTKKWTNAVQDAKSAVDVAKAKDMVLLWDSLQLAHKCILNSFYGYVMRKGARWQSIQMAGVVTKTGADIIKDARMLVEDIGRPLELDTDGIWCILPSGFPEGFKLKTKAGKDIKINYPCALLNKLVAGKYTNHQYQTLIDEKTHTYKITSECSIAFEVDGPYRAMMLPAAREEGKGIKKRYAVFNMDGTLAELKGFELKRRGELKLIKHFQEQVFKRFLEGSTLAECYDAVAASANHWLDILYSQGSELEDDQLFELISESKSMTKDVAQYDGARSVAITCAMRLAEFLGEELLKDKLTCHFIISKQPAETSVSDRAIPVAIFQAEPAVMKHHLRKWLKEPNMTDFDPRSILDWDYYIGRLSAAIQKIITIPAAFQRVPNPVPRVAHPDWLHKRVKEHGDKHQQTKLSSYFSTGDLEDTGTQTQSQGKGLAPKPKFARVRKRPRLEEKKGSAEGEGDGSDPAAPGIGLGGPVAMDESSDAEGSGSGSEGSSSSGRKGKRKGKGSGEEEEEEEVKEQPAPVPNEREDFEGWLRHQRRSWARLRERRKKEKQGDLVAASRLGGSRPADLRPTLAKGLKGYIRQASRALKHGHWQIVQIAEDEITPGLFRVWALLDSTTLQCIRVTVPRTFYINMRVASQQPLLPVEPIAPPRKVDRTLPRGKPCMSLWEVLMDERDFQSLCSSGWLAEIAASPEVEGVYEAQVPLLFRTLTQLGCITKLAPGCSLPAQGDVPISNLQYKTTAECPYLQDLGCKRLFLFHSQTDARGVWGIAQEGSPDVTVIIVNPYSGALDPVNYKAVLTKAAQELQVAVPAPGQFRFETKRVSDNEEAYSVIRGILAAKSRAATTPSIVLLQCPEDLATVYAGIPILKSDFPVVCVPSHEPDNQYPSLAWLPFAVRRMFDRWLQVDAWWQDSLQLCRYAHLPIGNLEADSPALVCDLFYARALKDSSHLLWISSSRADASGSTAASQAEEVDILFDDEHTNPELVYPGCYRTVSIEVELQGLAANTLLQAHLVDELEGSLSLTHSAAAGGADDTDAVAGGLGGSYACKEAFKVLKSCVVNWFRDVRNLQSEPADTLLGHFYRWIRSPSSRLHDHGLHRLVHRMMKKVFLQLLARFKTLKAIPVYGSFSKIIVATAKDNPSQAIPYLKYVIDSVKNRELFSCMQLNPTKLWRSLLFLDSWNYMGLAYNDEMQNVNEALKFDGVWNINEHLPVLCQNYFLPLIADFIKAPLVVRDQLATSEDMATVHAREEKFSEYMGELVRTRYTPRLFECVKDIQLKLPGTEGLRGIPQDRPGPDFPTMPGSHLPLHSPALEFVKTACHAMGLDKAAEVEVSKMRDSLMKLLEVKSFSSRAQFVNPCLTYILPDVICNYCNACRDLDLCRDLELIKHNWRCNTCQQPYDRSLIEKTLVDIVTRRSVSYQVQDLRCVSASCGKVQASVVAPHCSCSNAFACTLTPRALDAQLKAFESIAEYHGFTWLQETIAWIRHGERL